MLEWWRRRATPAELMVARTILEASGDHRAEALFEQLRASRRVERHVEGTTLRVVVPWTTEDLMVDLDEDVVSDPVGMRDLLSGEVLRFRVHLARGGFFAITDGMSVEGWAILGVRDLCVVEVAGVSYWQMAVGTGSSDDRRCLLRPDGALVILPVHDAPAGDLERVGTDLREWIAGLVGG